MLSVLMELRSAGCIDSQDIDAAASAGPRPSDSARARTHTRTAALSELEFSSAHLGRVASYYYLDYRTPALFRSRLLGLAERLPPTARLSPLDTPTNTPTNTATTATAGSTEKAFLSMCTLELLLLLSDALEFAELPVRHNEEHMNAQLAAELSDLLPLPPPLQPASAPSFHSFPLQPAEASAQPGQLVDFLARRQSFLSAHTKAFLLLLARVLQAPLPIADYINDTKSVLDQVPRVVNAMLDVAAEEGMLFLVVKITHLAQILGQV